jgi:hypothetical protein
MRPRPRSPGRWSVSYNRARRMIAACLALSLAACGTGPWGARGREHIEQPPAPPAAWLAPCFEPPALDEGRQLAPGEAWGAVFGPRGLIAAYVCERDQRACVRRWYAERLWLRPAAEIGRCGRQETLQEAP